MAGKTESITFGKTIPMSTSTDAAFKGTLPEVYGTLLVPLFFEPYANDMANRLKTKQLTNVLETAAGTGAVTRAMDAALPPGVTIVATDLNQAMLNKAAQYSMTGRVTWQQADALKLPFADNMFDAVVCQFGVMFFPDRARGYAEALRVLKPGGVFIFNVWDDIRYNDLSNVVNESIELVFPNDPPRFLPRTPYSYFDETVIAQDLAMGGFKNAARFETLNFKTTASTAETAASSICYGTPLRNDIESRNPALLTTAVETATKAIAKRFGNTNVEGKLQAKVVEVKK